MMEVKTPRIGLSTLTATIALSFECSNPFPMFLTPCECALSVPLPVLVVPTLILTEVFPRLSFR